MVTAKVTDTPFDRGVDNQVFSSLVTKAIGTVIRLDTRIKHFH